MRVGLPWLEQGTSVLSGLRSNQLSYRPAGGLPSNREILRQPKSEKQSNAMLRIVTSLRFIVPQNVVQNLDLEVRSGGHSKKHPRNLVTP